MHGTAEREWAVVQGRGELDLARAAVLVVVEHFDVFDGYAHRLRAGLRRRARRVRRVGVCAGLYPGRDQQSVLRWTRRGRLAYRAAELVGSLQYGQFPRRVV